MLRISILLIGLFTFFVSNSAFASNASGFTVSDVWVTDGMENGWWERRMTDISGMNVLGRLLFTDKAVEKAFGEGLSLMGEQPSQWSLVCRMEVKYIGEPHHEIVQVLTFEGCNK